MASVFQRNGVWYARVKDGSGRWLKVRCESVRTKTEARRVAEDLDRRFERQRLGLDPLTPADGGGTVAELLEWWLEAHSARSPSHARNESVIRKHLIPSELGPVKLAAVTPDRIEALLHRKAQEELSPQSINHLRNFLGRAFNAAIRVGRWTGRNPVASVKKRRVPKRLPDFLRPDEVPPVLRSLAPRWRPLFATAIYTGLRKGELLGLRKADVDLRTRLLTVGRSHDRDTTKGGHEDAIPIAAEAVPWLEAAMRDSPSELVFPAADGGMMRPDVALESVLRRALGRAGIVTGWNHVCRRKGCGYAEHATDGDLRRCPTDGRKLWPKPIVRPIRFHDLRHTTASLLLMAGADLVAVQRVMRHKDPKITIETYGHLVPGYLRSAVDRLRFEPETAPAPAEPVPLAVNAAPFVPVVSPSGSEKSKGPDSRGENPKESGPVAQRAMQDSNLRPSAPEAVPGFVQTFAGVGKPLDSMGFADPPESRPSHAFSAVARNFVPVVSPGLRVLHGDAENLLSVREAARRLGVSTATVYRLCERGELRHVRVSNAVRIPPTALAEYLDR